MNNRLKNFFLASFNEQELDAFIHASQIAKDKALDKMYRRADRKANKLRVHSKTFHRIVSGVVGLGLNKTIKQGLVSEWLDEAMS